MLASERPVACEADQPGLCRSLRLRVLAVYSLRHSILDRSALVFAVQPSRKLKDRLLGFEPWVNSPCIRLEFSDVVDVLVTDGDSDSFSAMSFPTIPNPSCHMSSKRGQL